MLGRTLGEPGYLGFPLTVPLPVLVPAVVEGFAVWISNQKTKKSILIR